MITDETRPEDFTNPKRPVDYSHIKGWGIDADPENDPTYPMKHRTDEEQRGYTWDRPEQQPAHVELLHSVERKNTPAVFGSVLPPEGYSGNLRRMAFKYSESDLRHWLALMAADRVNMVEGIADDISKGHFPNLVEELGMKSEWKYNKTGFLIKIAAVAAIVSTLVVMSRRKREMA
jgi:hypothetical protein